MKKTIKDYVKNNKVEIALYATTAAVTLELIVCGVLLSTYERGGSPKDIFKK